MQFSEGSDVWAFGVTVWEIFSLGQTPFKDTTLSNEFINYLKEGNRLDKPEYASEDMWVKKLILTCYDLGLSKLKRLSISAVDTKCLWRAGIRRGASAQLFAS